MSQVTKALHSCKMLVMRARMGKGRAGVCTLGTLCSIFFKPQTAVKVLFLKSVRLFTTLDIPFIKMSLTPLAPKEKAFLKYNKRSDHFNSL